MRRTALVGVLLVALAALGSNCSIGFAVDAPTAKPGLAPQFSHWPVPIYTSGVTGTMTWAANSYEIDTKVSRGKAIAWYLGRLKTRAMQIHKNASAKVPAQLFVDGGNFIVNFLNSSGGDKY